jgi:hypothetical protein
VDSLLNTIYEQAQSLSDISNAECGESTHRGGYTGESKERRIWRAGRHDWTKIVWVAVGTSVWSSASSSERSVDYRIRKPADATLAWQLLGHTWNRPLCHIHDKTLRLAQPEYSGKSS